MRPREAICRSGVALLAAMLGLAVRSSSECAPGCPDSYITDGICDSACNNAECGFDGGDCSECAPGCYDRWIANGMCNYACNNAECGYDGGDCSECAPGCYDSWIGNGMCDTACVNAECAYDGHDCYCAYGCPDHLIADGWCHTACNNAECGFDGGRGGDCLSSSECARGCYDSWITDGMCDSACYNAECGYDGGDCDYDSFNKCDASKLKLMASDGEEYDLGGSVALSGDYALVGAESDQNDDGEHSGAAYVFVRDGTSWSLQAKLVASDGARSDKIGTSVALSGEYALVGAERDDTDGGSWSGSAYVFVRDGTSWSQQSKLLASDGAEYDYFGNSVAISGDYALVGAEGDDTDGGDDSGSAYVFVRNGTSWSQQSKLVASDGAEYDYFGTSVALLGDYALVGVPVKAHPQYGYHRGPGSAYVFVRNGVSWSQQAKLVASDSAYTYGTSFGASVALSGNYALVGAARGDGNVWDSGSAYVFVRDGTSWSQQAKLVATDGAEDDGFGYSVALSGDYALVGAYHYGSAYSSAYVFVRKGTSWSQQAKLEPSVSVCTKQEEFGASVALSGDYALIGADDSGSSYVLSLAPPSPDDSMECSSPQPPITITQSDSADAPSCGESCAAHSDCGLTGYCDYGMRCFSCEECCASPYAAYDDACPEQCGCAAPCAPGCHDGMVANGWCNSACNNAECGYDGGDCSECAPGCYAFVIANGWCDSACNNAECGYDGGDCKKKKKNKKKNKKKGKKKGKKKKKKLSKKQVKKVCKKAKKSKKKCKKGDAKKNCRFSKKKGCTPK